MDKITLEFTLDGVNALLDALGGLPFSRVAPLIQEIHVQAIPQIQQREALDPKVVTDVTVD